VQSHKSEAEQLLAKLQEKDSKILDYEEMLSTAHIKVSIFWTMKRCSAQHIYR
jgi:hypothetical protein